MTCLDMFFLRLTYRCYTNVTIINLFCIRLPIAKAWHWHSLCSDVTSNVGAWGMWAFSLFLSFQYKTSYFKIQNWSYLTNSRRRDMAEILAIRRKTLSNQLINQSCLCSLFFVTSIAYWDKHYCTPHRGNLLLRVKSKVICNFR